MRHRISQVALRSWLDAQATRRAAEVALAQNGRDRRNTQASLHPALGDADGTLSDPGPAARLERTAREPDGPAPAVGDRTSATGAARVDYSALISILVAGCG